jgi:hypothetical protein
LKLGSKSMILLQQENRVQSWDMTAEIKCVAAMRLHCCSIVVAISRLVFLHFSPLLIKTFIELVPKSAAHLGRER